MEKPARAGASRYESTRNSFMKRNVESSNKDSEEEGSTVDRRMLSSKEE